MTYPLLNITIITYQRPDMLQQVLDSITEHVKYPASRLQIIVSFDELEPVSMPNIEREYHMIFHNRLGMGGNWNAAIEHSEQTADYTLCCQDDWLFTAPVDLRLAVTFLEENPQYGMVRYHKITGHHGLVAVMHEWDTSGIINYDGGENEYVRCMLPYFELQPPLDGSNIHSPYSGGVHLRHRRFTECYGIYRTGAQFSNTEFLFMEHLNGLMRNGPHQKIAMFPYFVQSRFRDLAIGQSYRETEVEKETLT